MEIEERSLENVVIVDLKGKLTLGEGDELLKEKIDNLMQQGHRNLLLNLESVPYVDSAGLGGIVSTRTRPSVVKVASSSLSTSRSTSPIC